MKKIFLMGVILLTLSSVGCEQKCEHEYELVVTTEASRHTFIAGKDFDDFGLEVSLKCIKCGDTQQVDYELENNTELSLEQTSVLIKHEDYNLDYPITVKNKFRIACVGDSLTKGHYWPNQSYPTYLSQEVNEDYEVGNFGENGISITGYGGSWDSENMSYINQHFYQDSLTFAPDIIALMLGTNDATGWANAEPIFLTKYEELLDSYLEELPNVKIIMMVSPPTKEGNAFGIPNETIKNHVNIIQRTIAEDYGFALLDLRNEFEATENYESLFLRPNNDGVHFTEAGAQFVANRVWEVAQDICF